MFILLYLRVIHREGIAAADTTGDEVGTRARDSALLLDEMPEPLMLYFNFVSSPEERQPRPSARKFLSFYSVFYAARYAAALER